MEDYISIKWLKDLDAYRVDHVCVSVSRATVERHRGLKMSGSVLNSSGLCQGSCQNTYCAETSQKRHSSLGVKLMTSRS